MAIDLEALMHNFPDRYQVVAADPPRFTILAASDRYLETVGKVREDVVGRALFDVFPEDPDSPGVGEAALIESFMSVIETKESHEMEALRYDVCDDDGNYETRWWRVINVPICDDDGNVTAILNRPEDISEFKKLQASAVVQTEKANKVGVFLLERGGLLALVVLLLFMSVGVVAWGLSESNRNTKVQIEQLKRVADANSTQSEQNEALLKELKTNQDLLKDCSTPGGSCFEAQIAASSVGAALGAISGSVITMLECVLPVPIPERTDAKLNECRKMAVDYQTSVVQQAKDSKK